MCSDCIPVRLLAAVAEEHCAGTVVAGRHGDSEAVPTAQMGSLGQERHIQALSHPYEVSTVLNRGATGKLSHLRQALAAAHTWYCQVYCTGPEPAAAHKLEAVGNCSFSYPMVSLSTA
jgi:hypothetical protein